MADEQGYDAITYSARGGVTMSFPNAGNILRWAILLLRLVIGIPPML